MQDKTCFSLSVRYDCFGWRMDEVRNMHVMNWNPKKVISSRQTRISYFETP